MGCSAYSQGIEGVKISLFVDIESVWLSCSSSEMHKGGLKGNDSRMDTNPVHEPAVEPHFTV